MISFLSRLFIKDRTNYNDSTVRKKYGTLTGLTGIFLNICLFAGKFIAGIVTVSYTHLTLTTNSLV